MIKQDISFFCACDNCGVYWFDEQSGSAGFPTPMDLNNEINNDEDWLCDGERHYCKDCWKDVGEDEGDDTIYEIDGSKKKEVKPGEDFASLLQELTTLREQNEKLKAEVQNDLTIIDHFSSEITRLTGENEKYRKVLVKVCQTIDSD